MKKVFAELDADNSGTVDRKELEQLVLDLNMKISSKSLDRHFAKMDAMETGEISFDQFCVFFNSMKAKERRKLIRKMKEIFAKVDDQKSGAVSQEVGFFPLLLRFSIGKCRNCPLFRAFY